MQTHNDFETSNWNISHKRTHNTCKELIESHWLWFSVETLNPAIETFLIDVAIHNTCKHIMTLNPAIETFRVRVNPNPKPHSINRSAIFNFWIKYFSSIYSTKILILLFLEWIETQTTISNQERDGHAIFIWWNTDRIVTNKCK